MEGQDIFKNYEYFIAIAEEGSISKAAQRLYISQPSLSKYLKRLEENIREELFIFPFMDIILLSGRVSVDIHIRAITGQETVSPVGRCVKDRAFIDKRVEKEIPCLGKNLLLLLDISRGRRSSKCVTKIVQHLVRKGFALKLNHEMDCIRKSDFTIAGKVALRILAKKRMNGIKFRNAVVQG